MGVPGFAINPTKVTKEIATQDESHVLGKIVNNTMQLKEIGTEETEPQRLQKLESDDLEKIQPVDCIQRYTVPEEAILDSMNSLDYSIRDLRGYMGSQLKHYQDRAGVQIMPLEAVTAACACASEITKMMSLKLKIAKFGHEIWGNKETEKA